VFYTYAKVQKVDEIGNKDANGVSRGEARMDAMKHKNIDEIIKQTL